MSLHLDRPLALRRASIYANPADPSAILPRGFGNWLDPNAVPDDPDDGGFTPAVCVDRLNLIYVINDGPVPPGIQVYMNKVLQTGGYLFNPSVNLEGQGLVATLQFRLNMVLDTEIAVRHGGSLNALGQPMTNPITAIQYILMTYAGATLSDFDAGTCGQTRRDLEILGWPFYWALIEDVDVRSWLLEVLPHFLVDATETGQGQLAMILDRSLTTLDLPSDIYHVPFHEIEDFGSPLTAVRSQKQMDDLANQITLACRYNWVAGQPTLRATSDFLQSQAAYRTAYPVEILLRGMYTTAHMTGFLNAFVTRHGFEPRVVPFSMRGLKGTVLVPPRLITVECPPRNWQRRLLKVRRRTTSYENYHVTLECIDTQRELSDSLEMPSMSLVQRRQQISRVYQWIPGTVGDHGVLEDAPGPTKNEAANGDFEQGDNGQWNLFYEEQRTWTIENDPAKAMVGRYYARTIPGRPVYGVRTLRRRINPEEWVLLSGWFRPDAVGANGTGQVAVEFYDLNIGALGFALGNPLIETVQAYQESLLMAQAPAEAYFFVPLITVFNNTTGQWRADKVICSSGSRMELLTKRLNDISTGNLILNGDFEAGDVNWAKDGLWYLDTTFPRSGRYHMTHRGEGSAPNTAYRLITLTRIPVNAGQRIRAQCFAACVGPGNGQSRVGITWLNGAGAVMTESAGGFISAAFTDYTYNAVEAPAPAEAVYATAWFETFDHTQGYWICDDFVVWLPA